MERADKLKALLLSSRDYYNHVEEYSKLWSEASQKTREKERDLLALSDQLRCLSMHNETNLSAIEIQRASDRTISSMEEKFSALHTTLELLLKKQEDLTTLRHTVENQYELLEGSNIVQQLIKTIYVSWVLFQMRSSSTDAAVKTINYKSPETIMLLLQCITGSDDHTNEIKDTLETAESLMSALELSL